MNRILRAFIFIGIIFAVSSVTFGQDDAQTYLNRGFSLYQQGQFPKALVAFEEGVKRSPAREDAYRLIGLCQIKMNDYDKAIVALKKAVELSDQNHQPDEAANFALGIAYFNKGQYADALPLIEAAAKANETAENYYYLGAVHLKLNNKDAALRALDKSAKLSPNSAGTLELTTQLYLQKARDNNDAASYAEAIKSAQQLKAVRDDANTALLLGQAYLGNKQYKEAAGELKKASDANPTNGSILFAYGQVLAANEQWGPAQAALEKAAQLMPTDPGVFNFLGYSYEAEGARIQDEKARGAKFTQALQAYMKADELSKGSYPGIKASIDRVKPFAK
ncbi:MAG TPA: tetratricopeptide repeat protein [Blastocatellia bacterium]|nr:tetratricopeptide repeat protein [Blastocatellia bacterium]